MSFNILVIDGGSLKGCIFIPQLKALEASLPAGKRLCDVFDLIVATSTGAIMGAPIAAGGEMIDIENLYKSEGKWIFTPQNSWLLPWRKLTRPLYDRERVLKPLAALLKKLNVEKMGELKTNFMPVTVDLCAKPVKSNKFLKSWERTDRKVTEEVAKSFSAPAYFGYYNDPIDKTYYADGGTGTQNCPLFYALIEAVAKFGDKCKDGIKIFSFGSGFVENKLDYDEAGDRNNVQQLLDVLFEEDTGLARLQSTHDQVNGLRYLQKRLGTAKIDFRRFDFAIPAKLNTMTGGDYIDEYFRIGEEYAKQNIERLKF